MDPRTLALPSFAAKTHFEVGHATLAIDDGDELLSTDPHLTERIPLPTRHREPGLPLESIPPDALAVISHSRPPPCRSLESIPQPSGMLFPNRGLRRSA